MVCANMIGTGVFTSLGFQLVYPFTGFEIMALWLTGGVLAVCGALAYGELAIRMPRSGGECYFLTQVFGRPAGFMAGWISMIAGFSAPMAAAAWALASYLAPLFRGFSVEPKPIAIACSVILGLSLMHLCKTTFILTFQNTFVGLKIFIITALVVAGVFFIVAQPVNFAPSVRSIGLMMSPAFATSLIFVSFAYSGWNAAIYITDEVKDPVKNLPRALLIGATIVIVLYMLLNYAFLVSTPRNEIVGKTEVAHVVATHLFGVSGGNAISLAISIALVSALSSLVWAGGRVLQTLGEQERRFSWLALTNSNDRPMIAILFQMTIALLMAATVTFSEIIKIMGVLLTLCSLLTVCGLFVFRARDKRELISRTAMILNSIGAVIYLLGGSWILFYLAYSDVKVLFIDAGIILIGLGLYYFSSRVLGLSTNTAVDIKVSAQS